jgi:type I restriction enzyme S subunit
MIGRVTRWKELERWIPGGGTSWEAAFPLVPIGNVMRVRRKVVSRQQFADYQPISIHFDGSIDLRDRTHPFKSSMFVALPGDLVYSKIDVRNGAIGLLPPEIKQAVVTSEYPVLVPDSKQVDVRYLALLLRSPNFQHLLKQAASGTSGRKRVHGDSFSELEIPLPEPTEQRQLLDGYEKALGKAAKLDAEALALEQRAIREFEAALGLVPPPDLPRKPQQVAWFSQIERWSHEGILDRNLLALSGKPTERYPLVAFADVVADLENGWSPQCLGRPAKPDEWGVLKLGVVRFGVYDETENKALPSKLKPDPSIEVKQGDVIISRANILRLVGACAIVHATRPHLMLCDKIFRVVFFRQSSVLPEFLVEILKTPSVRQQIEAGATGTSPTMKNISKPSLLDLVFPLPMGSDGLKVQARLIERLEMHRSQAVAKRTEATRLRSQAWTDFLGAIFN